jgi:predicted enzyme related to lactoylglutathione lyase
MNTKEEPEFIVTVTLIVADIARSMSFYRDVLAATVLREGEPTFLRLANTWIIINKGGGATDDKPEVICVSTERPQHVKLVYESPRGRH